MKVVLDRDKYNLLASFTDEKSGEQVSPMFISFRIDCLTNSEPVRAQTTFTVNCARVKIEMTEQDTSIIEPFNEVEVKRLVLVALFENREPVWQHFDFAVRNRLAVKEAEWKT